jgi:Acyl-CoA reductase (LuxC)
LKIPDNPQVLRDAFLPQTSEAWTPADLARSVRVLAEAGAEALAGLGPGALLAAWGATVAAFRDPGSPERRELDPELARSCRLSLEGLAAGIEAVLGGVREGAAAALLERARGYEPAPRTPVLAVLAANLPALAVQPLLPCLAVGRPAFLKSPSVEPLFAPAFLAALVRREPRLGNGLAAAAWAGGREDLEAPVLAGVGTILAYGGEAALADLSRRAPGKVIGYGPKTSLAAIGKDADLEATARGLGRDVALFDQRGCLSVAAVYTAGDAAELAARLARELEERARSWPPGPPTAGEAAAVQQVRGVAAMRGLAVFLPGPSLPLAAGTVVVDPEPAFQPSPGLRAVRIHPLEDLSRLPALLAPWAGKLQGAALAGSEALRLAPALAALGISRTAAPGELQSPDASWHNGGIDPLAALASPGEP